ncbi:MAG TPA: PilX N-terminal domain-containing pilus assembly protein [Thermoanaerobaculia bacterium]|nr:PilX N-terminal domain-containing pilus assembly protein [Thermoanaerobaculia bacterium]
MTARTTMTPITKTRGSALVSVILVLLVLTIVGVGIAYFTSMEDRLSGNTRIAKAAFYAADAGLRRAELALSDTAAIKSTCAPISLTQILSTGSTPTINVPGGGNVAIPLDLTTFTQLDSGGNPCVALTDQIKYLNIPVPVLAGTPVVDRATYSIYVRNNLDDATGTATSDTDSIINVVSVGTSQLVAGTSVTRILEEQILLSVGGSFGSSQKDLNAGGTGAAQQRAN